MANILEPYDVTTLEKTLKSIDRALYELDDDSARAYYKNNFGSDTTLGDYRYFFDQLIDKLEFKQNKVIEVIGYQTKPEVSPWKSWFANLCTEGQEALKNYSIAAYNCCSRGLYDEFATILTGFVQQYPQYK